MAKKAATSDSANRLLKTLRVLMRHALDIRLCTTDPCHRHQEVQDRPPMGYRHLDPEAEIDQFYAAHPKGSRARLGARPSYFILGQRRQDIVRMGAPALFAATSLVGEARANPAVEVSIPVNGPLQRAAGRSSPRPALFHSRRARPFLSRPRASATSSANGERRLACQLGWRLTGCERRSAVRLADAGCSANG